MKISIITVVYNAHTTISDTLRSVREQDYFDVEHILVDGNSSDGTQAIIQSQIEHIAQYVSEPDEGIYHAMNKGIAMATGDIIGILNADDVYQDTGILSQVAEVLANEDIDACYADLVYVKSDDSTKVVRHWQSQNHYPGLSFRGWMPAHPTLFLRREVYQNTGGFDTQLKYQADLEFCARVFEVHKISSVYIPKLWVRMRLGGATNNSLLNMFKGNWESYLALRKLGLKRNVFSYFAIKFASRLKQYFHKGITG